MVTNVAQAQRADTSRSTSTQAVQFPARHEEHEGHPYPMVSQRDRSSVIFALMLLIVLAWIGAAVIWGVKGLLGVALLLVPTMGCLIILITLTR